MILSIFLFCIILFIYLHVYFHLKTSNDLEIYNINQPSKDKLEEICDIRQPLVFLFENDLLREMDLHHILEQYGTFDVNIVNNKNEEEGHEKYIPMLFHEGIELLKKEEGSSYISENNTEFLTETGLIKKYKSHDSFLRPSMVSTCKYDLIIGSKNNTTKLQYQLNYRNYYIVNNGKVTLKLFPPNSEKYLHPTHDYDNFEFSSPVNAWNVQDRYKNDFAKIKHLDVTLNQGDIIHIPAYWWFTVKFDKLSSLLKCSYTTYMNNVATMPKHIMYYLQKSNTRIKNVEELKHVEQPSQTEDANSENRLSHEVGKVEMN